MPVTLFGLLYDECVSRALDDDEVSIISQMPAFFLKKKKKKNSSISRKVFLSNLIPKALKNMRTFVTCDPIPKGKFYHILPIKSRWAENSEVTKVESKLGSEKSSKWLKKQRTV